MELKEIIFSGDKHRMNWLRPDFPYGSVWCSKELSYKVENRREGDLIYTEIQLTNGGAKPLFTREDSIEIAFPLEDRYDDSEVCMKYRCHTHIFCGGNVSYIMALRMGGEAPHLGMTLTEGSLGGYSVERAASRQSNDRGCFYLHPSPMHFAPGETRRLSWIIFPHQGREDFYNQLGRFGRYVSVEADRYVLFRGETTRLCVTPSFPARRVEINGVKIDPAEPRPGELGLEERPKKYIAKFAAVKPGERLIRISVDGVETYCRLLVQELPEKLAEARCRFIAEHQQYMGRLPGLKGAYLAYDNEEQLQVYRPVNDLNGGRERVGMGLLMSRYLQQGGPDEGHRLEKSLLQYAEFVERELVDPQTGWVYNDIGRDDSYKREYNFPWYAEFFVELYRQYHEQKYALYAYRILKAFYNDGGTAFYPIELPVLTSIEMLKEAGMLEEESELRGWFIRHADRIAQRGCDYPPSEVNYEQSIVAPAADILLQVYEMTGDKKYLEAGEKQMGILELFNGQQPDYHLYESAIRHWDGYWFGKRYMYGDTFPHYWSALTGLVFARYAYLTGNIAYKKRADASMRGVLPLIFADGTASCAYVYPHSVNGVRAEYYDPYANDQDWGLYFWLRQKK